VEGLKLYEGWLNGKYASARRIAALARLAFAARQYEKAYDAVRQTVRSSALNHPAGPPPRELLLEMAGVRGDLQWSAKLHDALADCTRADCVRQHLGW
jgi:hypothetical protein